MTTDLRPGPATCRRATYTWEPHRMEEPSRGRNTSPRIFASTPLVVALPHPLLLGLSLQHRCSMSGAVHRQTSTHGSPTNRPDFRWAAHTTLDVTSTATVASPALKAGDSPRRSLCLRFLPTSPKILRRRQAREETFLVDRLHRSHSRWLRRRDRWRSVRSTTAGKPAVCDQRRQQ